MSSEEPKEVLARFTGHKVSKVKWRPGLRGSLVPSTTFVTGSWDEIVSRIHINTRFGGEDFNILQSTANIRRWPVMYTSHRCFISTELVCCWCLARGLPDELL